MGVARWGCAGNEGWAHLASAAAQPSSREFLASQVLPTRTINANGRMLRVKAIIFQDLLSQKKKKDRKHDTSNWQKCISTRLFWPASAGYTWQNWWIVVDVTGPHTGWAAWGTHGTGHPAQWHWNYASTLHCGHWELWRLCHTTGRGQVGTLVGATWAGTLVLHLGEVETRWELTVATWGSGN